MTEMIEMNNNLKKSSQNLQYFLFLPHREQHSYCDEKDHLAKAVLVHGCSMN